MKLLCCQQRKALAQIKSRLRAKDGQRPGSSPIAANGTFFKDEAKEIMILPHRRTVLKTAVGFQPMFSN
jgi:hypothetical protein